MIHMSLSPRLGIAEPTDGQPALNPAPFRPLHHSQREEVSRHDGQRPGSPPAPLQRCVGGNQNLQERFPEQNHIR